MNRSKTFKNSNNPTPRKNMINNNSNTNLGFLGNTAATASRVMRRVQNNNAGDGANRGTGSFPGLNNGNKATVMISMDGSNNQSSSTTTTMQQIQPGVFTHNITEDQNALNKMNLPPNLKDNMAKWREKRAARQQLQQMQQSPFLNPQPQQQQPSFQSQLGSVLPRVSGVRNVVPSNRTIVQPVLEDITEDGSVDNGESGRNEDNNGDGDDDDDNGGDDGDNGNGNGNVNGNGNNNNNSGSSDGSGGGGGGGGISGGGGTHGMNNDQSLVNSFSKPESGSFLSLKSPSTNGFSINPSLLSINSNLSGSMSLTNPSHSLSPPPPPPPPPSPPPNQLLFDPNIQEILKGMVEAHVKTTLDQLKNQRPELIGQNELSNILTQKSQNMEASLQQYNLREQRMKDDIDQFKITVKAIQQNVDSIRKEIGGAGVTEEVMRSYTAHFFGDQIGVLQKDIQVQFNNITERKTNELKALENNLKLLDTKFHNTLQNIFEKACFVFGHVVEEMNVYERCDVKSPSCGRVKAGEKILLYYPICEGNDNGQKGEKWMKTKLVHPDSAELTEGWVHVLFNHTVYVNQFSVC